MYNEGEIDYVIGDRPARLGAGDLLYVPAGTLRQAESPEEHPARLFSFDFLMTDDMGSVTHLPLDTFTHLGIHQDLVALCRQCCSEWIRQLPGYRLKTNAYLMELLHGVLTRTNASAPMPVRDKRILGMMSQILERADENLQLKDFARELQLSPVYLGSLFKQVTGRTFHQYLMDCRMNLAHVLLDMGQYTTLEVMLQCGFNDYAYFTRAFKRRFGVSPGKYTRMENELPIPPDVLLANALDQSAR